MYSLPHKSERFIRTSMSTEVYETFRMTKTRALKPKYFSFQDTSGQRGWRKFIVKRKENIFQHRDIESPLCRRVCQWRCLSTCLLISNDNYMLLCTLGWRCEFYMCFSILKGAGAFLGQCCEFEILQFQFAKSHWANVWVAHNVSQSPSCARSLFDLSSCYPAVLSFVVKT